MLRLQRSLLLDKRLQRPQRRAESKAAKEEGISMARGSGRSWKTHILADMDGEGSEGWVLEGRSARAHISG